MKWFEITTDEQAKALRPYRMSNPETPRIGDRVSPMPNVVSATQWPDYPESDRLTFGQCMAIIKDEVTEDVMRELGDVYINGIGDITSTVIDKPISTEADMFLILRHNGRALIELDGFDGSASLEIPNPTATKLRILAAILKGEKL